MTMTDRAIYADLLDGVFGAGAVTFDVASAETTQVLRALAANGNFLQFAAAFKARLYRLKDSTAAAPSLRQQIVTTANLIAAERNWDGAFAELAAFDYLLADPRTNASQLKLDVTVPATQTLASEFGMQQANFDVEISKLQLSLDVKLLGDKIGDILRGFFENVLNAKGIARLSIIPTYPRDDSYERYEKNRAALYKELLKLLDVRQQPLGAPSGVIPELRYQFAWQPGVFSGVSTYSTDEHARNAHTLLFQHAKKFSKVNPSVIVFVHFPWAGERLPPMGDAPLRFFKGMARHFFYGYSGSNVLAASLNKKIKSNILAKDVVPHLSGVIFLQDETITSDDPNSPNAAASFLMNAAAHHSLSGSEFERYLISRGAIDLSQL
jgi:hypothetical protein